MRRAVFFLKLLCSVCFEFGCGGVSGARAPPLSRPRGHRSERAGEPRRRGSLIAPGPRPRTGSPSRSGASQVQPPGMLDDARHLAEGHIPAPEVVQQAAVLPHPSTQVVRAGRASRATGSRHNARRTTGQLPPSRSRTPLRGATIATHSRPPRARETLSGIPGRFVISDRGAWGHGPAVRSGSNRRFRRTGQWIRPP